MDTRSELVTGRPPDTHLIDAREQISKVTNEERKTETKSSSVNAVVATPAERILNPLKFSSWGKVIRTTAYVRRYLHTRLKRNETNFENECVLTDEFVEAQNTLIRQVQRWHFASELTQKCKDIPKSSKLYQYNPFVDNSGIIRCRSRLEKSFDLSYTKKFPIILPGEDPLVRLLIPSVHADRCSHSGDFPWILTKLRLKYLPIHARRAVKAVIASCKTCCKFKAKPACEVVPPLPAFRLEQVPHFSHTGNTCSTRLQPVTRALPRRLIVRLPY